MYCKHSFKNITRFFVGIPFLRNNPYIFKEELIPIYSSSDPPEKEKSSKLSLIWLITFLKCICTIFKSFSDNNFHLF